MTEPNGARDLRDAIGEAHAEKHDLQQAAHDRERIAHADKHDAEQTAVEAALDAERHRLADHRTAHEAAHASHEKLHEAYSAAHKDQHINEHNAVVAATKAMDKRLDGMNEFRDQLRDQAATFVHRQQFDTFVGTYERGHDDVLAQIATEREERRANEGSRAGVSGSVGWIIAAIGAAATILSIIIVMANFLSTP